MAEDLEERLRALEEAQERRHEELLARLDRGGRGLTEADARAAMRRGYAAGDEERRAAAGEDGEA